MMMSLKVKFDVNVNDNDDCKEGGEECMTLYDQVYDKALKKERSVCHTV